MCNLYSHTSARDAGIRLFKVGDNRAAAIKPQTAIFPGFDAPVVRIAEDGERELVELSWGFVLNQKGLAPKRVTNVRDDKARASAFWKSSFEQRRCLVPVTSFCEPKGKRPAVWHWFAVKASEPRPTFAFAEIWRSYRGPIKNDGEPVQIDTYAFMTTKPNDLVSTIHPTRMPILLASESDQDQWLHGSPDEAFSLAKSYPSDGMEIVQSGPDKKDLLDRPTLSQRALL